MPKVLCTYIFKYMYMNIYLVYICIYKNICVSLYKFQEMSTKSLYIMYVCSCARGYTTVLCTYMCLVLRLENNFKCHPQEQPCTSSEEEPFIGLDVTR